MKNLPTLPQIRQLAVVGAVLFAVSSVAFNASADDAKTGAQPKPAKKLTGAELYAINCNRCHQERYPTEFTAAQWQTLMLHMRVRANLPAKQAKEILKYMKEEAGN
jgi:mono/diheme cytochrome c family protein